jgi:hypothetical protein
MDLAAAFYGYGHPRQCSYTAHYALSVKWAGLFAKAEECDANAAGLCSRADYPKKLS